MLDNRITFTITGLYNESRLFEFVETTQIDNYNVKYTLMYVTSIIARHKTTFFL